MKKGINAWCFPNDMDIEDIFAMAKKEGFEGLEVNLSSDDGSYLTLENTKNDCDKLKALSEKYALPVSSISTGLFWRFSLTDNDSAIVEKAKSVARTMIDIATCLGTDTILLVPGKVTAEVSYKVAYERAVGALEELKDYASAKKVVIGIENVWNDFLLSPIEMRRLIDELGCEYIQSYFDAGNVLVSGYPHHWVEALAGCISKVHIKDYIRSIGNINGFVNLLHGDLDWKTFMCSLRKSGYDGYVIAELSPYKTNPTALIHDTSKAMDYILNLGK